MRRALLIVPVLALAGCTAEGYPTTDTEMWAVVVIILGVLAFAGWICWLVRR